MWRWEAGEEDEKKMKLGTKKNGLKLCNVSWNDRFFFFLHLLTFLWLISNMLAIIFFSLA